MFLFLSTLAYFMSTSGLKRSITSIDNPCLPSKGRSNPAVKRSYTYTFLVVQLYYVPRRTTGNSWGITLVPITPSMTWLLLEFPTSHDDLFFHSPTRMKDIVPKNNWVTIFLHTYGIIPNSTQTCCDLSHLWQRLLWLYLPGATNPSFLHGTISPKFCLVFLCLLSLILFSLWLQSSFVSPLSQNYSY